MVFLQFSCQTLQFLGTFSVQLIIMQSSVQMVLGSFSVKLIIMQLFHPDGIFAVFLSMQFFCPVDYNAVFPSN